MSIIDTSYFKGDINIPFNNQNSESFQADYITPYEEEILVLVLGRDLYNSFITGIAETTPVQKWTNLRDGVIFQVNENGNIRSVKWEGLKNAKKISLIAYYIYSKWQADNYQQNISLGVSVADKLNAQNVEVGQKIVNANKKCAYLVGDYPIQSDSYLQLLYPNDIEEDYLQLMRPSLINFLYHNKSDYPEWVFQFPDIYNMNLFDL